MASFAPVYDKLAFIQQTAPNPASRRLPERNLPNWRRVLVRLREAATRPESRYGRGAATSMPDEKTSQAVRFLTEIALNKRTTAVLTSNQAPDDGARFVQGADGRRIAYSEFGAMDGPPVIYCHGFPSSRREAMLLHANAVATGTRLIAPDRPGYGDSDHASERTMIGWSDDIALLADCLRLERFAMLGVSGGGPYALACAANMPGRISACSLVCPLGPIYHDELLNQMSWAARASLMMGRQPSWFGDILLGGPTTSMLQGWPNLVEGMRSIAAAPADRQVLAQGDNSAILNRTIADAMRNGAQGARRDLILYAHDWQIAFSDIQVSINIWHGQADGTAPVEHARWYAKHLPDATLVELPGEGHYSVPLLYGQQILMNLHQNQF
jgi:pimeloyl-ACP methyl ester carboxylesterase